MKTVAKTREAFVAVETAGTESPPVAGPGMQDAR